MSALLRIAAALLFATISTCAGAQEYPTRAIRLIVPLTAGSGADIAGRIVAKFLTEAWHQPVVIENRPGAGGLIGTQVVTKSEPDGYTLLVQSASHAANSAIYKNLPYDPLKDLIDVARLGVTPYVMVTAPEFVDNSLVREPATWSFVFRTAGPVSQVVALTVQFGLLVGYTGRGEIMFVMLIAPLVAKTEMRNGRRDGTIGKLTV